jgi:hypothetical protein
MRLGEIKNTLENVLDEANKIVLEAENLYGGQIFNIKNYKDIMNVLEILNDQEWNTIDKAIYEKLYEKYGNSVTSQQITPDEHTPLNAYITGLNKHVPYFYSIISTMVEEQDEKSINIKLPEKISNLKELSSYNDRMEKLLKQFNIDGQFEFQGFDIGTSWYIVIAIGISSYRVFIACLKLAQEYFKSKQEYYKSKEMELNYRAALLKQTDYSKEGLNKYIDNRLELGLEAKVEEIINYKVLEYSHEKPELTSKLLKGTKALAEELSKGTEFHLSLNPPSYVSEEDHSIIIDYDEIKKMNAKKDTSKQISNKVTNENEEEKEEKNG